MGKVALNLCVDTQICSLPIFFFLPPSLTHSLLFPSSFASCLPFSFSFFLFDVQLVYITLFQVYRIMILLIFIFCRLYSIIDYHKIFFKFHLKTV